MGEILINPTEQPHVKLGRPLGALTATVQEMMLGHHHFAFLRAVAEGIHPGQAAERYLMHDHMDARAARSIALALTERILHCAQRMNDAGLLQAGEKLNRSTLDLQASREAPQAHQPSLEDFAAQFDEDMYTQSELLELYQEQHGQMVVHQPSRELIVVIDLLQSHMAKQPSLIDTVAQWFSLELADKLHALGVMQLAELVDFMHKRGKAWYRGVPRLGRARAARIERWLTDHALHAGGADVTGSPALTQQLAHKWTLDSLKDRAQTRGRFWAGNKVNTLGATNDMEAVVAWLRLLEKQSAATRTAYLREVERLVLWSLKVRNKGLSDLDATDLASFAEFVAKPPPSWVCELPYPRTHVMWRPFRGTLADTSLRRCLAVIKRLYSDLTAAGYLSANPASGLRAGQLRNVRLDVQRSFSSDDQAVIAHALDTLEDSVSNRRLRSIMLLFLTTGLRVSEAVAQWKQISWLHSMDQNTEPSSIVATLTVMGKGSKERTLPLRADVMSSLTRHRADVMLAHDVPESSELPLIGRIAMSPNPQAYNSEYETDLGMQAGGIYASVTRFLKRAAHRSQNPAHFEEATTHWLRHTFAHEALRSSEDLRTVQKLLGHSSINTTGIYLEARMDTRIEAIEQLSMPILKSAARAESCANFYLSTTKEKL
jgi:site-specific recombinase XerD